MQGMSDEMITSAMKEKNASKSLIKWISVAAVFVLLLTGVFAIALTGGNAVDSVIALDVNPSFEIELGRNGKVAEVIALNDDARTVLGEMDLEKAELDVALYAIVGSMLDKGYISTEQNSMLVSVNSRSSARAEQLKREVTAKVGAILGEKDIDASVITQTFEKNENTGSEGISAAKAALVQKILDAGMTSASGAPYSYETLAAMNVNELKVLLESKELEVGGIESSGEASNKAYIGETKATEIALGQAGLTAEAVKELEVDLDYERGIMVYEVEFETAEFEYEYEINALDGSIVKASVEAEDDDDDDDKKVDNSALWEGAITEDAAKTAALTHAGVAAESVLGFKVGHDIEKGRAVYEIEFKTADAEYECDVDALTGEVMNLEKEIAGKDDDDDDDDDNPVVLPEGGITEEAAIAAAYAHAGVEASAVTSAKAKLDTEKGVVVYEIKFKTADTKYDCDVNALTGEVVKCSKKATVETEKDDDKPTALPEGGITEEAAIAAALAHANLKAEDVKSVKAELETEKGVTVYEVEFKAEGLEYEYKLNALTGEIIEVEIDD